MNNNYLKPLIRWSGGKKSELFNIIQHLPHTIDTYIEPFVGGGALFFYLNPEKAVINDVHKELIDFYSEIKKGNIDKIYNFMESVNNTETDYYNIRDNMIIETSLDNAKRFFYLRKTCYRGMLRYNKKGKFNIPYGRYKRYNYKELKDERYSLLLERTQILSQDFEEIFNKYDKEGNFIFLDPPYDSEFIDYGYCIFGKNEHRRLSECFKRAKSRCLMIIGKTDFICELYRDYIVGEYKKNYKFRLHSGRVGNEINTLHLIIKNYE
jgi:DNA adenine methylase